MTPIEWLEVNAPGFNQLSPEERNAIMEFSLLWSFFEARALDTGASAARIENLVDGWARAGRLQLAPFAESLAHFKARYFYNGCATDHFESLYLRPNDNRPLVETVLSGQEVDTNDAVAALLISEVVFL